MRATTIEAAAEAEIRERIENWARAARTGDLDAITAHYAPDVLAFDAIGELQFKGAEAYRRHWQACLTMFPPPTIFEIHDLAMVAGEDLAFGHYLLRCGTTENGEETAGHIRVTVCHRRINGRWLVVHEHFSAPFDPASGKALLDLER